MIWSKVDVNINGLTMDAIAPMIVSASRATDIPAFYSDEFYNCLKQGYLYWTNPFNGKKSLISFSHLRFIVFWTKNANPIISYLDKITKLGINFYFNYTLNDYEKEGLEAKLPPLKKRIDNFKNLSDKIGTDKVIWRFDPLVMTKGTNDEYLIGKIVKIAGQIYRHTSRVVVSFVDTHYLKVRTNFDKNGIEIEKPDRDEFMKKLHEALKPYSLGIYTCADEHKFDQGIAQSNKCVDDELILKLSPDDKELCGFINNLKTKGQLKDKGQRKACGCMVSKDIGRYNSCFYSCTYCYAGFIGKVRSKPKIFG